MIIIYTFERNYREKITKPLYKFNSKDDEQNL